MLKLKTTPNKGKRFATQALSQTQKNVYNYTVLLRIILSDRVRNITCEIEIYLQTA